MSLSKAVLISATICIAAGAALAQQPGVVVQGSSDVLSGGLPAARQNDSTTTKGIGVEEGSPTVIINGRPAARVGDRTNCGVIVRGSDNVFINGRPMARTGDNTSGC